MLRSVRHRLGKAAILASFLILVAVWPARGQDDLKILTPAVEPNEFTNGGSLTGAELGKAIESALGKGNYQQVTIVLSTCHAGSGLKSIGDAISGPHNVIAACGAKETSVTTIDADKTRIVNGVIPGLLDAIIKDPTVKVDDALAEGAAGATRTLKGSTAAERAASEAAAKKAYEANRAARQAAAQAALDKAKADKKPVEEIARRQKIFDEVKKLPDWDKGGKDLWVETPASSQTADKPGQKPINAGKLSNHAIIYQPYPSGGFDLEAAKAEEALKKAKFDSVERLSPLTAEDYKKLREQQAANQPFSVPEDKATPANLKKKLESLKAKFNDMEALTVIVISHGGVTQASDRSGGMLPAGGGPRYATVTPFDHVGDSATASLLMEEAFSSVLGEVLIDAPYATRWDQPTLYLRTLQEFSATHQPVQVLLNNLLLSSFALDNLAPGLHALPLSDSFIDRLIGETDLSNGIDLSFVFGSPSDYFVAATAADFPDPLSGLGRSGIELVFAIDGGEAIDMPVPPSALLLGAGLLLLRIRRGCGTRKGDAMHSQRRPRRGGARSPRWSA